MKKSIIAAGAASVALAAMPIVGAMAVNGPFTDIIQTTVADNCTFARGTVEDHTTDDYHTNGTWTVNTPVADTDTLSEVTVVPRTAGAATASETTLGDSHFYVICNDKDGYQVALTTHEALEIPDGSGGKLNIHTWNYDAAGTTTGVTDTTPSYWKIESSDPAYVSGTTARTDNYSDLANDIVSKKESSEDGHDFTVTYKAFANVGQDSGSYSARAVYTFAQLPLNP